MIKPIGVLLGATCGGLLGFTTSVILNWMDPHFMWPIVALILTTFGTAFAAFVAALLVFIDKKLDLSLQGLLAAGVGSSNIIYLVMVLADLGKGTTPAPNYFDPGALLGVALLGFASALGFYFGTRGIPRWLENRNQ